LLRALGDQNYPRDRFECLVIDNLSEKPIRLAEDYGLQVRVLQELRPGAYAARNRGIGEARGDVLAFTDADCTPRRDWLSSGVEQIQAARRPLIVAGSVEVFFRDAAAVSICAWHSLVNDLNQARFVARFHFAATANMLTTREVFARVGPFNAQLFSGGDIEWGQRAWALGIEQVYSADTVVRHPARADWRSLIAKTRRIAGGHYRLHREQGRRQLTARTLAMTLRIAGGSLRRSWHDPRLPRRGCRLRVMALDLTLRLIQLAEVVRLGMGGHPRRR
jgi:glycosyltransferase involved in cell wall biosynthesis